MSRWRNDDMQRIDHILRNFKGVIYSHMSSVAPGLMPLLNMYCRERFGSEYLDMLLKEPNIAYNIILDYTGNEVSAKLLLYSILKPILGEETREAVTLLENGNAEAFMRLIASRADDTTP
ncbi:MAG: hypothetical protein LRS43_01560 [Desulfurococcales archaeon]|nr:hypothetical protein [Desulfurococcales archaeon]